MMLFPPSWEEDHSICPRGDLASMEAPGRPRDSEGEVAPWAAPSEAPSSIPGSGEEGARVFAQSGTCLSS